MTAFPHTRGQAEVVLLVAVGLRTTAGMLGTGRTLLRRRSVARVLRILEEHGLIERRRLPGLVGSLVWWRVPPRAALAWRIRLVPRAAVVMMKGRVGC